MSKVSIPKIKSIRRKETNTKLEVIDGGGKGFDTIMERFNEIEELVAEGNIISVALVAATKDGGVLFGYEYDLSYNSTEYGMIGSVELLRDYLIESIKKERGVI